VSIADETIRPTLLAAGHKGTLFVTGLLDAGIQPFRVVSYRQRGDKADSFDHLVALCRGHGAAVEENRHPGIEGDTLVLVVGWQFLLRDGLDRCIVLHDSLLPQLRGFAPTVTAMLLGSEAIGVTAIRPDAGADSGPIYGSRSIKIAPGASLQSILESQVRGMVDLAIEIIQRATTGALTSRAQDHGAATYSLWRDDYDYFLDWRLSAADILRHVQALGFPYDGAKGVLNNQVVTIRRASIGPELVFALRNPGKLWQVEGRRALVVCGSGTLWIDDARDDNGAAFHFSSLRARFLTADTAWIAPFVAAQTR